MELELLRRYGGIAIGVVVAFVLVWWTSRSRLGATLGIAPRSPRRWLASALAALGGLGVFIVLNQTARWLLIPFVVIGMAVMIVMVGMQARRRPDVVLPRTGLLLRWMVPIALVFLGLGEAIRLLAGPGIVSGLVAGLGLGLLPGVVLLAVFTLVTRLARAGRT